MDRRRLIIEYMEAFLVLKEFLKQLHPVYHEKQKSTYPLISLTWLSPTKPPNFHTKSSEKPPTPILNDPPRFPNKPLILYFSNPLLIPVVPYSSTSVVICTFGNRIAAQNISSVLKHKLFPFFKNHRAILHFVKFFHLASSPSLLKFVNHLNLMNIFSFNIIYPAILNSAVGK